MDRLRILVADEDIEIVGEATNGKETIEVVPEQTPDLVLVKVGSVS